MMQRIWILAAPLLLGTGCSAERAEPVDKDAIAQAVKTDVQSIVDAFNARDADAALAVNAPDTRVMSHGQPNMGFEENLATVRQYVSDPAVHLQVADEEVDVADAGDMAVYTATYDWEFTDPETGDVANEQGNWVMVFRRQEDGSLKIYREVISDIPASGEGVS